MPNILEPFVRALVAIVAVILFCRINGLRSFSKMSSFDFALTVATGSLLAGAIQNTETSIWVGLVAIASVFAIQFVIARFRQSFGWARHLTDNRPLLLVRDGRILHDHLAAARVTEHDLWSKLRTANVLAMSEVRAVVLETTGDISVLHAADGEPHLADEILDGVRTHF